MSKNDKIWLTAREIYNILVHVHKIRDNLSRTTFYNWRNGIQKSKNGVLEDHDYELRQTKGRNYYVYNFDRILELLNIDKNSKELI